MASYDFEKAKQIIKLYKKDGLTQASLGMGEDWYYTAETVWEDGKYIKKLNNKTNIGGITGSFWATPIIELIFKNETIIRFNCYK